MNTKDTNRNILQKIIPKGIFGWIGLIFVFIVAFSIGTITKDENQAIEESSHKHAEESPTTWTCSMHPQIQLPKEGKCPICFMDLIPLESGSGEELEPSQIRISETAKQLAQIQTSPVQRGFAETEIRMVGRITYDETQLQTITAWVGGRVEKIFADFTGVQVYKGNELVSIYSPELVSAQEELLQAKITVDKLQNSNSVLLQNSAVQTLNAVREKLRLIGLSEEQIVTIEKTNTTSEVVIIPSPSSGVVITKNVTEGVYVKPGTVLYTIADLSKVWIQFEAYESDIPLLQVGQHISFNAQTYPDKIFDAVISFIDPIVDSYKRTVKVRAIVDNKNKELKPDMFVSGILKSKIDMYGNIIKESTEESFTESDAPLLIPISAPLLTGKRAVVYVEIENNDDGPLYEGREVVLGPKAGQFYLVHSGLSEGERVVVNGAFKIDSELQIKAKPSMMSPDDEESIAEHRSTSNSMNKRALEALTPLYEIYFEVQMALANDDYKLVTQNFSKMSNILKEINMNLFHGEDHQNWMRISNDILKAISSGISASTIIDSRNSFLPLSKAILELENILGHADTVNYYLTYCPMAFDNTGAHWLQKIDTVYNSFYGDMMLHCGEIQKTFISKNKMEN